MARHFPQFRMELRVTGNNNFTHNFNFDLNFVINNLTSKHKFVSGSEGMSKRDSFSAVAASAVLGTDALLQIRSALGLVLWVWTVTHALCWLSPRPPQLLSVPNLSITRRSEETIGRGQRRKLCCFWFVSSPKTYTHFETLVFFGKRVRFLCCARQKACLVRTALNLLCTPRALQVPGTLRLDHPERLEPQEGAEEAGGRLPGLRPHHGQRHPAAEGHRM